MYWKHLIVLLISVECASSRWGTNCLNKCICNVSNTEDCNNQNGTCHCSPGWTGTICTTDLDECQVSGVCGAHAQCTNTPGSYICTCDTGYQGNDCNTDIDECSVIPMLCGIHGNCVNTAGSYTCSCDKGWTGQHCTDGDCTLDRTMCGQNMACVNGTAGMVCQCQEGYTTASSGECTGSLYVRYNWFVLIVSFPI